VSTVEAPVGAAPLRLRAFRQRRRGVVWTRRVLLYGAILVAWQLLALKEGPFFLPTLDAIAFDGVPAVFTQGYAGTFAESLQQLAIGLVICYAVAIPLGMLIGLSRIADRFVMPFADAFFITPTAALLPLVILVVGTGLSFRVFVVVLFAFYYPLVNTAAGVRYNVAKYRELSDSLCLSGPAKLWKIVLPASAPYVVVGVRLGLGIAVQGMIVAELWVAVGTGSLLINLGAQRRLPEFFALTGMVIVLSLALTELVRAYERRLFARHQLEVRLDATQG